MPALPRRHLISAAAALLCSCCSTSGTVGRAFVRPDPSRLVFGRTRRDDIVGLLGPPQTEGTGFAGVLPRDVTRYKPVFQPAAAPDSFTTLSYLSGRYAAPIAGGTQSFRDMRFALHDGTLACWIFRSDYPEDSTNFDTTRVPELRPGASTIADVERVFGPPSGQGVHPAIRDRGNLLYSYRYFHRDLAANNPLSGVVYRFTLKTLDLVFGPDRRLIDFVHYAGQTDDRAATGLFG